MATIRELKESPLERYAPHDEVKATYTVLDDGQGTTFLQIDTYGSASRKMKGKKSQTIRLHPDALRQLLPLVERVLLVRNKR
ncbi:MAG: methionyl-tRNA formyltransferase [Gemmatimonadetes bacterium]|nr:methionyl-tRNA formyltransferase [Gemmatimonadota bacterium]